MPGMFSIHNQNYKQLTNLNLKQPLPTLIRLTKNLHAFLITALIDGLQSQNLETQAGFGKQCDIM